MPPKKNATPVKPPEGSTMIHEESEDYVIQGVPVGENFKGMVRTLDLYNMEKKLEENMKMNMGNLQKKLEESMEMNMGNMEKKMENLEESM